MFARVRPDLRGVARHRALRLGLVLLLVVLAPALAQEAGPRDEKQRPPADADLLSRPAKELFSRQTKPLPLAAHSIGFYSQGCLAGAVALPINGATWQVMRSSRNRNWGHPKLIAFLERLRSEEHTSELQSLRVNSYAVFCLDRKSVV